VLTGSPSLPEKLNREGPYGSILARPTLAISSLALHPLP
jgi:hypothetical protein